MEIDLLPAKEASANTQTAAETGLVLTDKPQDLLDGESFFVLPQILEASKENAPAQTLTISFHITTHLASGGDPIEEDFEQTFDLKDISSIAAWQMNQNIIYEIRIKPTATDPDDPHTEDPEDVEVTFDPAVVDWETVTTDANILI